MPANDKATVIPLGFHTTYVKNIDTGKMDKPVDWVTYAPTHVQFNSTQIVARVNSIKPPDHIPRDKGGYKMRLMRHRWEQIEPAYKAWKEGHEFPVNGTPLAAWPGINNAQAQAFIRQGINTVERIAALPETAMRTIQLPNVRDLIRQAEAFLEASDQNSVANRMAEMEKKNEALQEQLDAATALLAELSGNAPKRGRPKKEASEDVEAA